MIEYRSIPLDIRESGEVQSLARKIAAWSSIHILQEYIKVLRLFHQSMTKCIRRTPVAAFAAVSGHGAERVAGFIEF